MNRKEIEKLMRAAGFTKGQRDSIYNRERAERLIKAAHAEATEHFKEVTRYADELCIAVDRAANDIGGSRRTGDILADLGPATDKAMRAVERYGHAG